MKKKYKYYTKAIPLPNGKRKYVRGKTKKELEEKLAALQRELDLGIRICDETTFREYAEHWLKTERLKDLSDNTKRGILMTMDNHIYPYLAGMKVRDIRATQIRDVMFRVSDLSHRSQSGVLGLLRGVFNAAQDDNLILKSPVPVSMRAGGESTKEAEWLSPAQEDALLKAAEGLPVYPFVYTILRTGLRRGEITGLMWSDVDLEQGIISVKRHVVPDGSSRAVIVSGAKTKSGVRTVPIPADLVEYLRGHRSNGSVYVFPNSKGQLMAPVQLTRMWQQLDKRAGFHTHPHMLRHTYVTKLFESGMLDIKQIQRVVGHANPNITLSIYTHYRASLRDHSTMEQVRAALG